MDSLLKSNKARPGGKDCVQAGNCSTDVAGRPVGPKFQLGKSAMTTFAPWSSQSTQDIFKIRGRMIPREEFADRLKRFCASLGFGTVTLSPAEPSTTSVSADGEGKKRSWNGGDNAIYVLSTKVSYNPNWGGCCGLPRLLDHKKAQSSFCSSPAEFIAPFLHLFRFAQESIFLSQTEKGRLLITLPENLVRQEEGTAGCRLKIHLERIVEPAEDGTPTAVILAGSLQTFAVSPDFQQSFSALTRGWRQGRKLSIGHYLSRDLFSFVVDGSAYSGSPYGETLLPNLTEIVTHPTPNLRAAEIHLQQVFARDTARLASEYRKNARNLLYIAGLDIDMTPFSGREEHYFVPWQAYISQREKASTEGYTLTQDDLYVQMMQQNKQYLV